MDLIASKLLYCGNEQLSVLLKISQIKGVRLNSIDLKSYLWFQITLQGFQTKLHPTQSSYHYKTRPEALCLGDKSEGGKFVS